jgi:ABC-type dipeptide/oligopeptide/nickel transport system permease component
MIASSAPPISISGRGAVRGDDVHLRLFYIIGGQYLIGKLWHLVPISGYDRGSDAWKFLILPVIVGVIGGIGAGTRWYRTLFLEEIGKDYVRTARAKGLSERRCCSGMCCAMP